MKDLTYLFLNCKRLSPHSIDKYNRETNIDEDFFLNKNALQRTIRITIDIKIKESTLSRYIVMMILSIDMEFINDVGKIIR